MNPKPPVVSIRRHDNGTYPNYTVILSLNGVDRSHWAGSDYGVAAALAHGIAAGVLAATGQTVIESFPRSVILFDLHNPSAHGPGAVTGSAQL